MNLIHRWRLPFTPFHRAFPSANREVTAEVTRRTAVDRDRNFIYFRIPKAANSTVMFNLAETPQGTSQAAKRMFPRIDTLTAEEVTNLRSRFFLFTVVRDPYARIASAYLDKIVRGKRSAKVLRALGKKQAGADITFLEFCRYLEAGGVNTDPHWYRQVDLIPCGIDALHFIGRVESLNVDLQHILTRIGKRLPRQKSWTRHQTGANKRLLQLYSDECVQIIKNIYAKDFDILEYSSVPSWKK